MQEADYGRIQFIFYIVYMHYMDKSKKIRT